MDVHSVRQMMRTKSIYEIPMRVTFYARVSSEKDEQLNSLDNQISYYRNFIKKNTNWEFVEGYIDEGLSGMSTKKRENFHNMISDAKAGLFDLVITKEITRFARNDRAVVELDSGGGLARCFRFLKGWRNCFAFVLRNG